MSVQEILDRAVALHRDGALAEATGLYRQAFADSGAHPTVANLLSIALDQQGKALEAERILEPVLAVAAEGQREAAEACLNLARLRARRGALAEAIEPARRAAVMESGVADARILFFEIAARLGRREPALEAGGLFMADAAGLGACLQAIELARQAGAPKIAQDLALLAARMQPSIAAFQVHAALVRVEEGRLADARRGFRRSLICAPNHAVAANGLANLLMADGEVPAARRHYGHAVIANPAFAEAEANLAMLLGHIGETDAAISHAGRATELAPGHPGFHTVRALGLQEAGRAEPAILAFKRSLLLDPVGAEAWNNLASAMKLAGRPAAALAGFRRSVLVAPGFVAGHRNLGVQRADLADMEGARAAYEVALGLAPNDAGLAFKAAMTFPTVTASDTEIDAIRGDIHRRLAALRRTDGVIVDPMREVGLPNFYLAYHGRNDRDIQAMIADTYLQLCPDLAWPAPHCSDPVPTELDRRIRIGFFSVFFHDHSIRYIAEGVIQNLDPDRFELFVISNRPAGETSVFPPGAAPEHFVEVPNDLFAARARIAGAALDILVYCDIGMEPLSYYLAFARLAPVQCVLQGHPVSTGIPNVDYFISSAWQEPEDFSDHYTETCVRLNDIAFCYLQEPEAKPATRASHGLPEHGPLYFCPQTLFKFHPRFDAMLHGILERDPEGHIVLLRDLLDHRTKQLAERLSRALGPVAGRVLWLDRMSRERYFNLIALSDVMLDTPYFSGGNTTIQSLALGVPTVTFVSPHVRGRITLGWMRILDTMELAADTAEDYARIAVASAKDEAFRRGVQEKLAANGPKLFRRMAVVREHERFFQAALDAARAGRRRLDWGP